MGGHRVPMREDADLTLPGMAIVGDFLDALDLADFTLVVTDWGGALLLTDLGRDKRVARLVICPSEAFDNFPPGFPVAWLASRNTLVATAMADVRSDGEKSCPARHCRRTDGARPGRPADPAGPREILPHQVRRRRLDPGHEQP
jgi:pimeloyl-ACP methyl ester carboxylesterase